MKSILEHSVTKVRDFSEDGYIDEDNVDLPKQNFIQLTLENGFSVAIRPSGTEPKIKYYLFGCGERNPTKLEESKNEVTSSLNAIGEWLVEDAHQRAK